MNDQIRAQTAAATVRFTAVGGQGVLIPGGFIVTAALRGGPIDDGGMVLSDFGDFDVEPIETKRGMSLKVTLCAVEPVNDIAVFGAIDGQVFYDNEEADFRGFCERTNAVLVCSDEFEFGESFTVHILTHHGTWIGATATRYGAFPKRLALQPEEEIEGGTSGGPIINDRGELVGIVSHSSIGEQSHGWTPQPNLTMPVWLWSQVEKAMRETDE